MPFAFTLRLDAASAEAVEGLRTTLGRNAGADIEFPSGAPHVTLAILPSEDAPVCVLKATLLRLAAQWQPVRFRVDGFGFFPRPRCVIWAAPSVTWELTRCYTELLAALDGMPVCNHQQRGNWVPHITLGTARRNAAQALETLLGAKEPIEGLLDQIELLRFDPLKTISLCPLTGGT